MRIGIDIDGTITDSYSLFLKYAIWYDKNFKQGKGIINQECYDFDGKFNWTNEDKEKFMSTYSKKILEELKSLEDAKEVINRLKEDGNEIYFITSRSKDKLNDPYTITARWLNKEKIKYDKLITDAGLKGKVCKDNNIDILIDDSIDSCKDVSNNNIRVLLFDLNNNKESEFEKVHNWKEVYKKLGG